VTRIAVVEIVTHLPAGGAQRVALTLAERLDRDRFAVRLVAGPRGEWVKRAQAIPDGAFHPLPDLVREIAPLKDARALTALVKLLRALQRDHDGQLIVHTHAPKAGLLGRAAARLAGAIPVHTLHGLPFYDAQPRAKALAYRLFERLGYLAGGHVVSVTETNRDFLVREGWVRPERASVIPPCADLDRVVSGRKGRRRLARFGIPEDAPVLGMVASLKPPKDPLGFLKAAKLAAERRPDAWFVLVGDGELRPAAEAAARGLGLDERTIFTGWLDPIEDFYAELDGLVLPTFSEGLPLVLVEARAAGVPCVASDVGGVAEALDLGEAGLLVSAGDDAALADVMVRLLGDASLRERLVERGKIGLDRFRPEAMTAAYEALFTRLAGAAQPTK